MIDLRDLRENPEKYRRGAQQKRMTVDIDRLLALDAEVRSAQAQRDKLVAEKNQIGSQIGQLANQIKKAGSEQEKAALQASMKELQQKPAAFKQEEARLDAVLAEVTPKRDELWLTIPLPPDADVPVGAGSEDNKEISRWNPPGYDAGKSFFEQRGFHPRSHVELGQKLGLVDFERGVKIAGSRSYVLTGDGMRLHNAVLRFAFDFMTNDHGFTAASVPVLVRDQIMVGTGFFPHGKEQAYAISNPTGEHELYLTGTGEVGLMGLHQDEIVPFEKLPLCYTTVSTCFRREAGSAGKDTAGLYRIHQFDKVEQVVICKADEQESRGWHRRMIGFVEQLLQKLGLPYRLLQCCTGDLGPKNADMVDIECWMPSRGEIGPDGKPTGAYGETHSASRLYDYQCRRLNIRYKDPVTKQNVVCHSLNNTVLASPRVLIPILELNQNADGSVNVPAVLQPHMGGRTVLTPVK